MAVWWTYRLEDFLLFSPKTYYRLYELYNAEIWPLQLLAVAFGVAIPVLIRKGGAGCGKAVSAILALGWVWVAWGFHYRHYATINWAAVWFAAAFALQAGLLVWVGVVRGALDLLPFRDATSRVGLGVFLFALLIFPLVELSLGRSWGGLGVFGISPDPTVLATLGVLLMARQGHGTLLLIPLAWCVVGGATLWSMGSAEALLLPAAGLLVLVLAGLRRAHT